MVPVPVTSQPLKVLQKSQDTNLNDLHMLLDVSFSLKLSRFSEGLFTPIDIVVFFNMKWFSSIFWIRRIGQKVLLYGQLSMCKPYLGQVLLRQLSIYLPVMDSLACVVRFTIDKGLKRVHFLHHRLSFTSSIIYKNNEHFLAFILILKFLTDIGTTLRG